MPLHAEHVGPPVEADGFDDAVGGAARFDTQAAPEDKQRFFDDVGWQVPADQANWELIRLAMSSVCNSSVLPMQDVLGLGPDARMNTPGTCENNWKWRLRAKDLTPEISARLADLTRLYGRE